MIFKKSQAEKTPKWGPNGVGMKPVPKKESVPGVGVKGNDPKETKSMEDFLNGNPQFAAIINRFFVLQNDLQKSKSLLAETKVKLDTDMAQCQIFEFQPKYMTACQIAALSNDITKNVSIEQVRADYEAYNKNWSTFYQTSESIIKINDQVKSVATAAQSSGVSPEAASQYEKDLYLIISEYNQQFYAYNAMTRTMDILLMPGPGGKSVVDYYQEIIDLGTRGCKICQDAASSFNTMKGIGPVTSYVFGLISIYLQISNIYKKNLAPIYSSIGKSANTPASKAKIQNTVDLLANRIPQAYSNEILKARYGLMIAKTYGYDNTAARSSIEKFLDPGGATEGKSSPSSAPSVASK